MKRTTLKTILSIACTGMLFVAHGQNARVDALGGASIVPDFSRTLYNPAIMNDYKDHAQVTFNGGAIMATKSAGGTFSIGAVMNRGLQLRQFYSIADSAFDYFSGSVLTGSPAMQYFPHILWGFDLAGIQIGFDTYLELNRATYHSLVEVPGAFQEIDGELTVSHPGCIMGLKFNLSPVTVLFHVGAGMPRATGTLERKNVQPVGTAKIETETGLFGRLGGEADLRVGATNLTLGFDARYEEFQFSRLDPTPGAQKVRSDKIALQTAIPYFGATTRFSHDVMAVFMARSGIDMQIQENDAGSESETDTYLWHTLLCGVEKVTKKAWKFDSLALRGGISWAASSRWNSNKSTSVPVTQITDKPITTLGPAYPYCGVGASKGFLSVDMLLNPASWSSAVTGPAVSRVTVSLRY